MTKTEILAGKEQCFEKAHADEPLFILRANDPIASEIVMTWVRRASGVHEPEKVNQARAVAMAMSAWKQDRIKERNTADARWLYFDDLASNSSLLDQPLRVFKHVQMRETNPLTEWRPVPSHWLQVPARQARDYAFHQFRCSL